MYTPSEQKFIEAFCKELGGVILPLNPDMAEKTAAAFREYGTVYGFSHFGGCDDRFAFGKAVRGERLQDLGGDDVADGGLRHEKHVALVFGNAHAFAGQIGDGECNDIIFFQHKIAPFSFV
jgi:hypothetical protein